MQDRPTAQELLATIGDLLQGEILDSTSGPLKHQVRVAGNLCRILERQQAMQPGNDERAIQRIAGVLESDAAGRSLEDLNRELATQLATGEDPELEQRAWPALLEIVRAKLAVNKPGHDAYDFAAEVSAPEHAQEIER